MIEHVSPDACFFCDGEPTSRRPVKEQREFPGTNLHRSCARELARSLESDAGGGPELRGRRLLPPPRMGFANKPREE
jgi:hypothetical protein